MKKILSGILSLILLLSITGCQQTNTNITIEDNVCAFIKEIKDDTILIDIAEYITADDIKRIEELELSESDMPDGYYIYNVDAKIKECFLTADTKYNFIDWHNIFVEEDADRNYSTTNKEDFITYLNSYENSQPGMPFFFEITGDKIISITEKPMM